MSENIDNVVNNDINESESNEKNCIFPLPLDPNNDELILAQEKQIEKDIAESIPLVGNKLEITALLNEYSAEDSVYQQKVLDLQKQYKYIRKTRPDGNCFFRAFSFSYFECLISDNEEFNRFWKLAQESKDILVKQGFPEFTIEDFHETLLDMLRKISTGITTEDMVNALNDSGISDYIVVYLRLITSGHLQKESEFFSNFIEGERTIIEFCKAEVEPMFKESDHIHIIALTASFNVGVRIIYMDRGIGGKVNMHDFGIEEGSPQTPRVNLLYRPGHYDILYPN